MPQRGHPRTDLFVSRQVGRPTRSGFTLIELLLVIFILVVLVGLLLPAVQKVRGAAARMTCNNNLKQMGMAFHSHHDAIGRLPYGGWHVYPASAPAEADPFATTPQERQASWSWAYLILPYLEQANLFKNPDPTAVRSTPVKQYYCPARRSVQVYNGLAKIDYAGNAGSVDTGANGVVMQTPLGAIRMRDITDGASCTLLLAEKQLNTASLGLSTDDNESYCTPGWNGDWEVYRSGAVQPEEDSHLPGDTNPHRAFGSAHTTGFNCVFCDGSVRYLRYSVSLPLWTRVCVRNDNERCNHNDL